MADETSLPIKCLPSSRIDILIPIEVLAAYLKDRDKVLEECLKDQDMAEYTITYPLCQKYDAPVIKGCIPPDQMQSWLQTLPDDWGKRFGAVCGPTTQSGDGLYACDAEATLWSLERGKPHRRWNG
jgi:hypothetical protein